MVFAPPCRRASETGRFAGVKRPSGRLWSQGQNRRSSGASTHGNPAATGRRWRRAGRRTRRGRSPRRSAIQAAVIRTHSGSLRPRGAPGGERYGESVSTRIRSAGARRATSAVASSPARNARPEKRSWPRARASPRRSRPGPRTSGSAPAAASSRTPGSRRAARPGRRAGRPRNGSGGSQACRSRRRGGGCVGGSRAASAPARTAGRSRGRSPRSPRRAGRAPARPIRAQAASSTRSASCGWTPTAASSHGNRSTSSSARRHESGSQPGTRIRSTPASRAAPITWSTSASNRSAWRWQWESTRRTGGLSPTRLEAGELPRQNLVDRDRVALAVGADRVPALAGDLRLWLGDRPAELLDLGDRCRRCCRRRCSSGRAVPAITPRLPRRAAELARARTGTGRSHRIQASG